MHKILGWGYSNDTKVTEVEWLWNLSDLYLSSWGSRPWQPGETPGPQSSLTALMLVLVHYPDNTFIQHTVSFIYRETGWWIKGHQIKLRGTTSQDQGRSIMKKLWFKLIYYLYNSPFTVQMILQSFSNKSWVQEMIEDTNWLTLPILLPLTSTVFILAK